jgi:hypothetical protein
VGSVYSLDLETDGTPDYTGSTLSEQAFVYLRPGVHLATLHVEVPDGRVLVARAAIQVYERTQLDARLQGRWTSFKTALRNGDAAEAASFLHGARRAAWGAYFSRMTTTQLAAMDSAFTNIVLVEVTPRRAEYEMRRDEGGVLYSFRPPAPGVVSKGRSGGHFGAGSSTPRPARPSLALTSWSAGNATIPTRFTGHRASTTRRKR